MPCDCESCRRNDKLKQIITAIKNEEDRSFLKSLLADINSLEYNFGILKMKYDILSDQFQDK